MVAAVAKQIVGKLPPSSAKIRMILKLLGEIDERSQKKQKTIVFSQFTSFFNILEPFLIDAGIKYVRCKSSIVQVTSLTMRRRLTSRRRAPRGPGDDPRVQVNPRHPHLFQGGFDRSQSDGVQQRHPDRHVVEPCVSALTCFVC